MGAAHGVASALIYGVGFRGKGDGGAAHLLESIRELHAGSGPEKLDGIRLALLVLVRGLAHNTADVGKR